MWRRLVNSLVPRAWRKEHVGTDSLGNQYYRWKEQGRDGEGERRTSRNQGKAPVMKQDTPADVELDSWKCRGGEEMRPVRRRRVRPEDRPT